MTPVARACPACQTPLPELAHFCNNCGAPTPTDPDIPPRTTGAHDVGELAKVRDYLLSREHPIGQFKAAVFESVGYRQESWQVLQADLLAVAAFDGARLKATTEYGQLFEVPAMLQGPLQRVLPVISVWLLARGENIPRLVTVYPRGRRWRTKNATR